MTVRPTLPLNLIYTRQLQPAEAENQGPEEDCQIAAGGSEQNASRQRLLMGRMSK
jgi:hypothetical protein